jgi:hypothetical protein
VLIAPGLLWTTVLFGSWLCFEGVFVAADFEVTATGLLFIVAFFEFCMLISSGVLGGANFKYSTSAKAKQDFVCRDRVP